MKTYVYDIPLTNPLFGRVLAQNLRKAKSLLRAIFNMRALPPKPIVRVM